MGVPQVGTTPGRAGRDGRGVRQTVAVMTAFCGLLMLYFGVWAFFAPMSFSNFVDYQPYNEHLIHDAGVFQIAIGSTTLLALVCSDTILLGLTGFVIGSGLHTVSHYLDRHIGGHATDVPLLGLFTIVGICAAAVRIRGRKS